MHVFLERCITDIFKFNSSDQVPNTIRSFFAANVLPYTDEIWLWAAPNNPGGNHSVVPGESIHR
ncbi:MAG: hypothetical protein ABIO81_02375 [Ginsengibacter sp.]